MYNEKVAKVVLENTPQNAKYTLHHIQKDILYVLAKRLRNAIREEIGDSKFWIIVDEARVESKKEQMAIVLRFVDKDGFIQERFFDIVHVKDWNICCSFSTPSWYSKYNKNKNLFYYSNFASTRTKSWLRHCRLQSESDWSSPLFTKKRKIYSIGSFSKNRRYIYERERFSLYGGLQRERKKNKKGN